MTAGRLRVACAGAGFFSQFHIGSWTRMPEVELAGIWDRDAERAAAFGIPAFGTLEEMLGAVRPDILDIILPPPAHADVISRAMAGGVRTMICQKPFCQSLDEAANITGKAEAAGVRIVIHENFRFQPWFRAIRRALDRGAIGEVLQATFRLRPGDGQGPDAYLSRQPAFRTMPRLLVRETGVHFIDTFRFLFGTPTAVYADLRQINPVLQGEDAGFVIFDHPGGMRSVFDGNRHLDHAADNLRRTMGEALIEGTEGTIVLRGDGSVALRAFGSRDETEVLGPDNWDGFGGDCVHALQCHVVRGLIDGTPLENEARDYLDVLRVEEAAYRSAEAGCKFQLT